MGPKSREGGSWRWRRWRIVALSTRVTFLPPSAPASVSSSSLSSSSPSEALMRLASGCSLGFSHLLSTLLFTSFFSCFFPELGFLGLRPAPLSCLSLPASAALS